MEKDNGSIKSVLVVEDEPGIAKICERTLTAEGFQVDIAVNGEVGLDMLRKKNYDLCISDIRTPHMNGMELYQQLENENPGAIKTFIFSTGDVLSGHIKEFLEKTGRPYLPKPFTPDELRAIVRKVMVVV
ncbi:MAG TPA: response regulator [Dehalococcoidales bacterium]